MIRRALLLLSLAAVYIVIKNSGRKPIAEPDHLDDAQWANEGGANAPASV